MEKLLKYKRLETDSRMVKLGKKYFSIEPRIEIGFNTSETFERNDFAYCLKFKNNLLQLPDVLINERDGIRWVIIEKVSTNEYGYFDNGESEYALMDFKHVQYLKKSFLKGILNLVAEVRIKDDEFEINKIDPVQLVRRQG